MLYKSRERVMKLSDDYSRIVSEAKYNTKDGEGLKTLIAKQVLQRIALAKVIADNASQKLLNEIRQIKYSFYWEKEITK